MAYDAERSQELLLLAKTNEVIEELIKLNEGLMYAQLNKFGLLKSPDGISLAYEALFMAIKTFDPKGDTKFSTYATVCIYNRLGSLVRTMNNQINTNTISYDEPVEEGLSFIDLFESTNTSDGEMLEREILKGIRKVVSQSYDCFSNDVHKKILTKWIESEFKLTNAEIAAGLNCSQSYVNQIINRFRKIVKNKLREWY